jgi:phosphoglucosamine mutase
MHRRGELRGGGIVGTVMSNLGLERHLERLGLRLDRTKVGDRYVVERMREKGYNMGGEQSGHIIFADHSTTGDGLIAALQVLAVLVEADAPLSKLAHQFERVPQLLRNVRFEGGSQPLETDTVKTALQEAEERLGRDGRLVVRKSGTEPLIRIMAEHGDSRLVNAVVGDLEATIRRVAGG